MIPLVIYATFAAADRGSAEDALLRAHRADEIADVRDEGVSPLETSVFATGLLKPNRRLRLLSKQQLQGSPVVKANSIQSCIWEELSYWEAAL